MTRTIRFTVEGRGEFPLDMLRYSSAWPTSSIDAEAIRRERDRRSVTLETDRGGRKNFPLGESIVGRFASFGWRVVHADGMEWHPQAGWFDPADVA